MYLKTGFAVSARVFGMVTKNYSPGHGVRKCVFYDCILSV